MKKQNPLNLMAQGTLRGTPLGTRTLDTLIKRLNTHVDERFILYAISVLLGNLTTCLTTIGIIDHLMSNNKEMLINVHYMLTLLIIGSPRALLEPKL